MSNRNILQALQSAGAAGGATLDVDNVFNTQLYTGDASVATQTFNTSLDMQNEGGMIWFKSRSSSQAARIIDTERGTNASLIPTSTNGSGGLGANGLTFLDDGFSLGWTGGDLDAANDYVAWSFRKAPKFFDVVTYSGNSQTSQTIAHSLGSAPGMMIIKRTDGSGYWWVYHKSIGADYFMRLSATNAREDYAGAFNDTEPTATHFTVGSDSEINYSGRSYVAYLFADNNNDGEFGPDSDADIIKCGSYTGNNSADGPTVNLGFEPQWLMIKNRSSTGNWGIFDNMRGVVTGDNDNILFPDLTQAEGTTLNSLEFTSTGFKLTRNNAFENSNGDVYIYMAIRRGSLNTPEDATKVFAISQQLNTSGGTPSYNSGFPVDMAINKFTTGTDAGLSDRLRGAKDLLPSNTIAEYANSVKTFDYMDGYYNPGAGANSNYYSWMWKRARGYLDVVCYTGTGSNTTVAHNLGVAPEMMWVKIRNGSYDWHVQNKDIQANQVLNLNSTASVSGGFWNTTRPTSTVFTLGSDFETNRSGYTYIAYLFATVAGVSKVGSVTHSGSSTDVDCGFASGARFVLLKRTDSTGSWVFFDSVRGIVAGNDPYLKLNSTAAQVTSYDHIDPLSSGFQITGDFNDGDYIFYAIA